MHRPFAIHLYRHYSFNFSIFNRIHEERERKMWYAVHITVASFLSNRIHYFQCCWVFFCFSRLFFIFWFVCGIKAKLNFNLLKCAGVICVCMDFVFSFQTDRMASFSSALAFSMQFNRCFPKVFPFRTWWLRHIDEFEKWIFQVARITWSMHKYKFCVDDMHQSIRYASRMCFHKCANHKIRLRWC